MLAFYRIEGIQSWFLKRIGSFETLSYSDRLKRLDLHSLHHRRLVSDMMIVYKFFTGEMEVDLNERIRLRVLGVTRGHELNIERWKYQKWFIPLQKDT